MSALLTFGVSISLFRSFFTCYCCLFFPGVYQKTSQLAVTKSYWQVGVFVPVPVPVPFPGVFRKVSQLIAEKSVVESVHLVPFYYY